MVGLRSRHSEHKIIESNQRKEFQLKAYIEPTKLWKLFRFIYSRISKCIFKRSTEMTEQ